MELLKGALQNFKCRFLPQEKRLARKWIQSYQQTNKVKIQNQMTEMVLLSFSSSCITVINCALNFKTALFDQHQQPELRFVATVTTSGRLKFVPAV